MHSSSNRRRRRSDCDHISRILANTSPSGTINNIMLNMCTIHPTEATAKLTLFSIGSGIYKRRAFRSCRNFWVCYSVNTKIAGTNSNTLSCKANKRTQLWQLLLYIVYPVLVKTLPRHKPFRRGKTQNPAHSVWNFKSSKRGRSNSISNSNRIAIGWGINRGKFWPRQRFSRGRVFPSTGYRIIWYYLMYIIILRWLGEYTIIP